MSSTICKVATFTQCETWTLDIGNHRVMSSTTLLYISLFNVFFPLDRSTVTWSLQHPQHHLTLLFNEGSYMTHLAMSTQSPDAYTYLHLHNPLRKYTIAQQYIQIIRKKNQPWGLHLLFGKISLITQIIMSTQGPVTHLQWLSCSMPCAIVSFLNMAGDYMLCSPFCLSPIPSAQNKPCFNGSFIEFDRMKSKGKLLNTWWFFLYNFVVYRVVI